MNLTTTIDGTTATIVAEGKLSVATSPDLEHEIAGLPTDVSNIVIDLAGLDYISSAGLRVLVSTQKLAGSRGGSLVLANPKDEVMDVFEMTGLVDVFEIQR